jgi:hypothetical protein
LARIQSIATGTYIMNTCRQKERILREDIYDKLRWLATLTATGKTFYLG